MRIILLLLITILTVNASASINTDSFLKELDQEVAIRHKYDAKKYVQLNRLWHKLHREENLVEQSLILDTLFNKYKNFSMDTLLLVARHSRKVANNMGDRRSIVKAMMKEAEAYKNLGYYQRALRIMDSIPRDAYPELRRHLLERYTSIYYSLAENSLPVVYDRQYQDSLLHYRDTLMRISPSPEGKAINLLEYYKEKGEYEHAINEYYKQGMDTMHFPIMDFIIGEAYVKNGQNQEGLEFLTRSAIADLRQCDRKYNSLPMLAKVLYEEGDYKRAYNYIMRSLSDIKDSNAQSRMARITDALPIISATYNEILAREDRLSDMVLGGVIIILVLLVGGTFIIVSKNRKLHAEQALLMNKNEQMVQLQMHTDHLNELLEESAKTKEEYIGELFNLSSEYINIMARERTALLKTVRNGKLADVERAIMALQDPNRLSAFFEMFDQCFLDIFPHFIQDVNKYIRPEMKYEETKKELTPELRILALMRLGIYDNNKIASFLHYSTQTVYNYKFKIRSKLNVDKEEFMEIIPRLGAISKND